MARQRSRQDSGHGATCGEDEYVVEFTCNHLKVLLFCIFFPFFSNFKNFLKFLSRDGDFHGKPNHSGDSQGDRCEAGGILAPRQFSISEHPRPR